MGKTELIQELQGRLVATEAVLFSSAKLLGVELKKQIAMHDVSDAIAKMNAAIASLREEASYAPEERGHSTLSGGALQQFDDHDIDREVTRSLARAGAPQAQAQDSTQASADHESLTGILAEILRDLGIEGAFSPLESAAQIAIAIANLKGGGDVGGEIGSDGDQTALTKGDTLAQAWQHNSAMRDHLGDELKGARTLLDRIANALQIQSYDRDGTELLERVQRWDNLKYTLKKRRNERIKAIGTDDDPVVAEQTHLLSFLVAPKMLAEWIARKPTSAVGPGILEAAQQGSAVRHPDLTMADLLKAELVGSQRIVNVFDEIKRSRTAADELLLLLNRVIIPLVERQHAAQQPVAGRDGAP